MTATASLAVTPDTTPPAISGVSTSGLTSTGVTIAWTTNEAADTQVSYGTTASLGMLSQRNIAMVTNHSVELSGLSSGMTYYYQVRSEDPAVNLASSSTYSFTTAGLLVDIDQLEITPLQPSPSLMTVAHAYDPAYAYSYRVWSVERPGESFAIDPMWQWTGDLRIEFRWDGKYYPTEPEYSGLKFPVPPGTWRFEVTATDRQTGVNTVGTSGDIRVNSYRHPVILMMGFTGSRLYERSSTGTLGDQKWLPEGAGDVYDLEMDYYNRNKDGLDLVPTSPILNVLWPGFWGTDILGQNFVTRLETEGWVVGETLTLWAYDWRQDVTLTAQKLADQVQLARRMAGEEKVTLLAHSMGGLISKEYLLTLGGSEYVNAFVSIGTPYLGAVVSYQAMVAGDVPIVAPATEQVLDTFPSTYQLLPSEKYFEKNGGYVDTYAIFPGANLSTDRPLYQWSYLDTLNEVDRFPFDQPTGTYRLRPTGEEGWGFASRYGATLHQRLDLKNIPGVKYHAIVATGIPTLLGMSEKKSFLDEDQSDLDPVTWQLRWGDGDGTVPTGSAIWASDGTATVVYMNDAASSYIHREMPGSPPVIEYIVRLLRNDGSPLGQLSPGIHEKAAKTVQAESYSLFCPVDVHIYDELGNHTGPTENGVIERTIPGVQYEIIGDSKHWVLPSDRTFQMEFKGTGTGVFDLHVSSIAGNETTEKTVFNKIPVDPNLSATMVAAKGSPDRHLIVKREGASAAKLIHPSATTRGKENLSRRPAPVATAAITGLAGLEGWYTSDVRVELTAADRGRGVLSILYKRPGDPVYRPYTEPLTLTNDGILTLLAGATDRLGEDQPMATSVVVKIDKTAPETTDSVKGLSLALTATDSTSGVAAIEYTLDGARIWHTYAGELLLDGPSVVSYRSRDVAGNTEAMKTVHVSGGN